MSLPNPASGQRTPLASMPVPWIVYTPKRTRPMMTAGQHSTTFPSSIERVHDAVSFVFNCRLPGPDNSRVQCGSATTGQPPEDHKALGIGVGRDRRRYVSRIWHTTGTPDCPKRPQKPRFSTDSQSVGWAAARLLPSQGSVAAAGN